MNENVNNNFDFDKIFYDDLDIYQKSQSIDKISIKFGPKLNKNPIYD